MHEPAVGADKLATGDFVAGSLVDGLVVGSLAAGVDRKADAVAKADNLVEGSLLEEDTAGSASEGVERSLAVDMVSGTKGMDSEMGCSLAAGDLYAVSESAAKALRRGLVIKSHCSGMADSPVLVVDSRTWLETLLRLAAGNCPRREETFTGELMWMYM